MKDYENFLAVWITGSLNKWENVKLVLDTISANQACDTVLHFKQAFLERHGSDCFDINMVIEEKKQAAADVLYQYSKFAMACIGNRVRPCDLRLHLMKEISGLPTSLKRESSQVAAASDVMGESSSSGTSRLDKADSFRAL
ncbi:uncharacterized protein LOC111397242 isoform X1 [Olea europaea var. sylvestris]|uniref:uncharacterized protein LOC111397242 isoform X1 n=1 Tax=Olea europaea var. sylvestris TaxID=158386 RepID=UPI000C1D729B|nr:uncharacterized protein LOC111397242 isoform X1 [Olea europaea var. sylvestris]